MAKSNLEVFQNDCVVNKGSLNLPEEIPLTLISVVGILNHVSIATVVLCLPVIISN